MTIPYIQDHKKLIIGVMTTLCLIVLITIFTEVFSKSIIGAIYPKAYALNLIPKPETFTELYFENHELLPIDTNLNKQNSFTFTVHNLEGKQITYPYEIYIIWDTNRQVLGTGSITLNSGEYKSVPVTYTLLTPLKRAEIVVNLKNKKQQIDFWIGGEH